MEDIILFDSIKASNDFNNHPTLHPLVTVTDFSKAKPRHGHKMKFEIYAIILKEVQCGDVMYGKGTYDYQEGTLMFCGTLAAHGGVRPTHEFAFELEDPVLGRKIAHAYRVRTLPNLG